VSPNVTSAVIHKAQSQSNIVQTCLSICMKDSIFVPQYEKPYAALGMLGMLGMLFFYFFIFFKELQQPHWKNLPLPIPSEIYISGCKTPTTFYLFSHKL